MNKFNKNLGHHGFTIVEIMVALMLVVLVFGLIPMQMDSDDRSKLEESIQELDRAVKFSINESILRNSVTRLTINLEADPQEYIVEYGTTANIVLPNLGDEDRMSLKEREQQKKMIKNLDAQFTRVEEFANKPKIFPEGVTILAVASSYLDKVRKDGQLAIYFYPTGEKDNSLIFIGTDQEVSWINIPPFENKTMVDYYTFTESELVNLDISQDNKVKEVFDQWIKD